MEQPIYIVDAFADAPFAGNPAAVVPLVRDMPDLWMQKVAAEMNLSETAFIYSFCDSVSKRLRWFTPTDEVDLCGHATMASAHVLGGTQHFETRSGELICTQQSDGWMEMDFPNDIPILDDSVDWSAAFPDVKFISAWRGISDYLLEVGSEEEVMLLTPVFSEVSARTQRGVIVTAPSDAREVDFVSRCFYPRVGVPEDPVTGSAHCTLASWWSKRLGKDELVGIQKSRRSGKVRMKITNDRVLLSGQAFTVMSGVLKD